MRAFLLISVLILGACTSSNRYHTLRTDTQTIQEIPDQILTPPLIIDDGFTLKDIPSENIFALSAEHQAHFLDYFNHPIHSTERPHRRIKKYLEKYLNKFDYRGETFNARQALDSQSGNCLSLAILSTAFTKLTDLDYKFNLVHVAPIYEELGDIQVLSSHVNFTIYDKKKVEPGFFYALGKVTIDYFRTSSAVTSSEVSEKELSIMYWHNLTADALLAGNIDLAFTYTKKAYNLDPLYPETLNFLAVLYNRRGYHERAYAIYDFMLKNQLYTFTAIDNFASLLRTRGEHRRADGIAELVIHITNDNPYTWLHRGIDNAKQGKLKLAESQFKKSLTLAPYLHEPHFQLAKLYAQQLKMGAAKKYLEQAFALAYIPEHQQRYKAKLYSLKRARYAD
ncbi:tetratricopeptide repeat protein [Glaciecola petra]|uniref:TPR domain protein n=1 Tax=Glaciecola petra TaxID=3075602 RepID=A0ABU2ZTR0_9ALTE|nr:hypothetical protein [Aestuariibacter sp. P117]MDT0596039.1 hypothetical protein [Aestuariibacter sp. P117]